MFNLITKLIIMFHCYLLDKLKRTIWFQARLRRRRKFCACQSDQSEPRVSFSGGSCEKQEKNSEDQRKFVPQNLQYPDEMYHSDEDEVKSKVLHTVREFQKTLPEASLKELEVMKSMGLPTYFLNAPIQHEEVCVFTFLSKQLFSCVYIIVHHFDINIDCNRYSTNIYSIFYAKEFKKSLPNC